MVLAKYMLHILKWRRHPNFNIRLSHFNHLCSILWSLVLFSHFLVFFFAANSEKCSLCLISIVITTLELRYMHGAFFTMHDWVNTIMRAYKCWMISKMKHQESARNTMIPLKCTHVFAHLIRNFLLPLKCCSSRFLQWAINVSVWQLSMAFHYKVLG